MKFLRLSLLSFFTIFTLTAQNDVKAKKMLDNVSNTMSAYQNIYIEFDYALNNKKEDVEQNMSGDVVLSGEKYLVNIFETTQMFDGSKTFTIIPENEEVNISDADIDDKNTVTPSKFYSFYKNGYTFKMGILKKIKGKKIQFVVLTPMDSHSEMSSVLVGVNLKDNHIYQIIEKGKNGTETILTAKNIKTNQKLKPNLFVFNRKEYEDKGFIIND